MATKKYTSEYEEDLDRLAGQLNATMDWEVRLAALQALEHLVRTGKRRPSDVEGWKEYLDSVARVRYCVVNMSTSLLRRHS